MSTPKSHLIPLLIGLLVYIPSIWGKTSSPPAPKSTQEQLIGLAAIIQNHEAQLTATEQELSQARTEENRLLEEIDHHHRRFMETLHYLRHAGQYSPLLALVTATKQEDVIHSSLLLRSIAPEIQERNQHLLEKIKTLSQIRTQLEEKQNRLRDITFHYHQKHESLNALLKDRPKGEKILKSEDLSLPDTLIPPVVGKLIPTYGHSSPEWASFTQGVLFSTRPGAHVVSPLSGTIAFAGEYAQSQGQMVIVQTPTSHVVMSGLGSLNCTVGQNIMAGEPVGRMPPKDKTQNTPRLYLEIWHQEQTIDPQSILKIREKES